MRKILACIPALALTFGASSAAAQSHNITTVAGTGMAGYTGDGGLASQAQISVPVAVRALPDGGYLIFHQGGSVVRRVSPFGIITTVAGSGTAGYTGDGGPATIAQMNAPSGGDMTADGGYLIADANNNAIRRVAPDGTMSTAVGDGSQAFGGDGGPASAAKVRFPYEVVVQRDGGYLIADVDNNRIRRVGPDGIINTVAGGGPGGLGDGGPATSAVLFKPSGVALTADGGFLIADTNDNLVRKVAPDGTISSVAGTGATGSTGDGGPATQATLNHPSRVAVEPDGGFIIADALNARLRRVAPDGTITTVAGTTPGFSGDGSPATGAQLDNPIGAAVTLSGDYLIADANNQRIRLVDADPPAPVLTSSSPASPADNNSPRLIGRSAPGTTVQLFASGDCSGASVASGTGAELANPGIAVTVADNSTTIFHATATDSSGNTSPCSSSAVTYVESTLPPPVRGKTVNAIPEKGVILVKVPGRGGFVPLETLGRQLPVGSTINATSGTVLLASATARSAKVKSSKPAVNRAQSLLQVGRFSKGVFKFNQTRKNPLVTLSMTGGGLSSCSKLPPGGSAKVTAAKRRRRSLFSNVKGRFRTRGRNSTATVRGTAWQMIDTCAGTRTAVTRGSVTVRDFTLRKTRVVKAGRSYFAKAPK